MEAPFCRGRRYKWTLHSPSFLRWNGPSILFTEQALSSLASEDGSLGLCNALTRHPPSSPCGSTATSRRNLVVSEVQRMPKISFRVHSGKRLAGFLCLG